MFKFEPVEIDEYEVKAVDHHRNGVCGTPFYCAVIHDPDVEADMLVTHFEIEGEVCTAVYQIDKLPNIRFGENSWRGDRYSSVMKDAIKEYREQFDRYFGLTD